MLNHAVDKFFVAALAALAFTGCASGPNNASQPATADMVWLQRLTFGVDSDVLAQYRKLGREGFLAQQLQPTDGHLPDVVMHEIAELPISQSNAAQLLATVAAEQRRINTLPDGPEKQVARQALYAQGNQFVYQARRRELLRAQIAALRGMYVGNRLESAVTEGLELQQQVAQAAQDEMLAANRGAISTKGFELTAERMARFMRTQYRLGFVDVGGWDTHVNEGGAHGALAANLTSLGSGLATFAHILGDEWNSTVVFVLSEFGRTFRENGNGGTDHGHGSVYWVLGGRINGGRIAGEQVRVEHGSLFQDRDYPVLNNYRGVLSGLFGRLWGLAPQQLDLIFPGAAPLNLNLV
ncbi:MAG TPA: DUF1501 domain-containing protein [Steroidobacteraceae bacterium]